MEKQLNANTQKKINEKNVLSSRWETITRLKFSHDQIRPLFQRLVIPVR